MRVWCNCGRTLNPEGKCDASHALTEDQYAIMLERRRKISLNQNKELKGINHDSLGNQNTTQKKRN